MIEQRLVQWYAADAGVDLDIAEREVTLTYVLCILSNAGLLDPLAFKGGTALRKIYLGGTGRFSLDLDFTATGGTSPDTIDLVRDVQKAYRFLRDLTPKEAQLANDPYGREASLHRELAASIASWGEAHGSDG